MVERRGSCRHHVFVLAQNWAIQITYSHFDLIDCWLCIWNIIGFSSFFRSFAVVCSIHSFIQFVLSFGFDFRFFLLSFFCWFLSFLAMTMTKIVITCTRRGKYSARSTSPLPNNVEKDKKAQQQKWTHCAFIAAYGHNKLCFASQVLLFVVNSLIYANETKNLRSDIFGCVFFSIRLASRSQACRRSTKNFIFSDFSLSFSLLSSFQFIYIKFGVCKARHIVEIPK